MKKTDMMKEVEGDKGEQSAIDGGIYEVSFGYNAKMKRYTILLSDILILYAMF